MTNYLKTTESNTVNAFVNKITKRFKGKIQSIILYGSKVRGDFNQDSDIDILVIINGKVNGIAKEIVGIAFDIMVEQGPYISVKVFEKDRVQVLYSQGDAFIRDVLDKGEKLWEMK
jgi:predicted nucleotidyltransferase